MSSSEVDLELILKPGGPVLSGVAACHIIVNSDSDLHQQPNVIMLVGEIHGKQTSGEIDYVTAYLSLLKHNEKVTRLPLDIMLEADNDYVAFSREPFYGTGWITQLRDEFQNCYVSYERDEGKCKFEYARAHWSNPVNGIPQWLLDVNIVPDYITDWYTNKRYSNISIEITSENDLEKIIFENPHIVKQGEQCKIKDWKGFIISEHRRILKKNTGLFDSQTELHKGQYWFRKGIFDTRQFSMDVYAFLRMFRAKNQQSEIWTNMHRFENIIFHAGRSHTERVRELLLNIASWDHGKYRFKQIHEAVYHPDPNFKFSVENINSVCCKVDFHKFLETIHSKSKIPVPTRPSQPHTGSPVFIRRRSTQPRVFIRRVKEVKEVKEGGTNSNRIRKLKTRRTRRTRRVKPKSVIKKNTRRRRYCYY